MKLLYRLAINISDYGFVLNQYIIQCLEYTYLERKKYVFVTKNFIRSLVGKYGRHMVYILMMVEIGILYKHIDSYT